MALAGACSSDPVVLPDPPAGEATPASTTQAPVQAPPDAGARAPDASPPAWTPPVVPTSSPACAGSGPKTIAAGTTLETPDGRTMHVWGPEDGYDRTKTWPVVLMFHGIQTNGADFESWFEMEKYVDSKAIVVYPDAEDGYWDASGTKDLAFFDAMMKKLGETYCIDPSRVLGFGFSWGAFFAHHLGCNRAGWVKAISAGDGGFGGSADGCGRLPVLVTHRTADTNEVVQHGRDAAALWTKLNACGGGSFVSNADLNCTSQKGCSAPGSLTYCEDTWFDPAWPTDWNHTVRETYRSFTWSWFSSLP